MQVSFMKSSINLLSTALRIIVASACLVGIFDSVRLAAGDVLFRRDTEQSIRSAIRLVPDAPQYYMRLAQLDDTHSKQMLEAALRLNRYNAEENIELALRYEADGNYSRAERLLLDAFAVDDTYLPRWSLANFYLRRDDLPAFWIWAHRAAEMPADDIGALFELCWKASSDPDRIASFILTKDPQVIRQYLIFLLTTNRAQISANVASSLIRSGDPNKDRPLILAVVNRLVVEEQPDAAANVWRALVHQRWVIQESTVPTNASFTHEPLPVSFDWTLPSYPGISSVVGPSGLETELSGVEPEVSTIAEQVLVLSPGSYVFKSVYRTVAIPPETGIEWQIVDCKSGSVLASSPDLSSNVLTYATFSFNVGQDAQLLRLRLLYQRAPGTTRVEGTLKVVSTEIGAVKAT